MLLSGPIIKKDLQEQLRQQMFYLHLAHWYRPAVIVQPLIPLQGRSDIHQMDEEPSLII